jgi:hypothetical protein
VRPCASVGSTQTHMRGDPTEKLDAMGSIISPHPRRGARVVAFFETLFSGPFRIFHNMPQELQAFAPLNRMLESDWREH